ncbi:MAG: hypothetical protein P4L91_06095 [Burkholderiaceae bacterium]|nr:hypothetical protein [Burkholderiaceae bacterium]
MNWRHRHMTNIPHPSLPRLRIVGWILKDEIAPVHIQPSTLISEIIGDQIVHPDTMRLNHLLAMHHEVRAPAAGDNQPQVESIHFIYDAGPGASKGASLRAAIDHDIEATIRPELKRWGKYFGDVVNKFGRGFSV